MRIVHCIASWAFIGTSSAFIVPKNEILKSKLAARDQHLRQIAAASRLQMLPTDETVANADLHVVLFGLGDLRVNDHGGLHRAMDVARKRGGESKVLPLFVLDEKCLMNFPGCRTASADTGTVRILLIDLYGWGKPIFVLLYCIIVKDFTVPYGRCFVSNTHSNLVVQS